MKDALLELIVSLIQKNPHAVIPLHDRPVVGVVPIYVEDVRTVIPVEIDDLEVHRAVGRRKRENLSSRRRPFPWL